MNIMKKKLHLTIVLAALLLALPLSAQRNAAFIHATVLVTFILKTGCVYKDVGWVREHHSTSDHYEIFMCQGGVVFKAASMLKIIAYAGRILISTD